MKPNSEEHTQLASQRDQLFHDKRVKMVDSFIEQLGLDHNLGNVVRQVCLFGHSLDPKTRLEQARYFLNRAIRFHLRPREDA